MKTNRLTMLFAIIAAIAGSDTFAQQVDTVRCTDGDSACQVFDPQPEPQRDDPQPEPQGWDPQPEPQRWDPQPEPQRDDPQPEPQAA